MDEFAIGGLIGILIGIALLKIILILGGNSPFAIKQQAFDRGYMVECVGESGYHWECEK